MSKSQLQGKLRPSLLDRLTDHNPHQSRESRASRDFSADKLREAVARDLSWLMNTTQLSVTQELTDYPLVEQSVLNYGVPDLAGKNISGVDVFSLQKHLKRSILYFEPRLLGDTLEVRLVPQIKSKSHNCFTFEIKGDLWAGRIPEKLSLRTQVNLENGSVSMVEA